MKSPFFPSALLLLTLTLLPSCKPKPVSSPEVPAPTPMPSATPVAADEQPSSSPQEGGNRGNFQQRAQQRLDQMTTTVGLTQDQSEKVKAIMQEQFGALRGQAQGMSREDRRAAFQKARDAANAQIEQLLTPDQKPKWEEYQKQMEARRAQRGQGGAGGNRGGGGGGR